MRKQQTSFYRCYWLPLKNSIKGVLFCSLCYGSIVAGYLCLFCPLLPVVFLSAPFYHRLADFVCAQWQKYPTALLKYLIGTKFLITGPHPDLTATSLIVCNHRTRTDWLYLWAVMYQHAANVPHTSTVLRFVLKQSVRHVPALGWVMQLCCHLFLQRDWSRDERKINQFTNFYARMSNYVLTLLMFPEGTDFNRQSRLRSDQFAERHGLKKLKNVLYPHTTGFNYLLRKMMQKNQLTNLYDFTLIYTGGMDSSPTSSSSSSASSASLLATSGSQSKPFITNLVPQTEFSLLRGEFPEVVIVRIDKYSIDDILVVAADDNHYEKHQQKQTNNQQVAPLALNLTRLWQQKDLLIDELLRHHWLVEEAVSRPRHSSSPGAANSYDLIGSLIFWSLLQPFALLMLYAWPFFGFLAVFQTAFLISFNVFFGDFLRFEAFLCRLYFIERFLFFVIILLTYSCSFYLI